MPYSFFFLTFVLCSAYANTLNLPTLRLEALNLVNSYRRAHCVPELILNTTLNNLAQGLTDQAAATHDMRRKTPLPANVGESGYVSMVGTTYVAKASAAINIWYAQNSRYNCATGTSSSGSADFTKMIWRSSMQFGFGVAMSADRRHVYMVADYVGAGNVAGEYLNNVPCKCPATSTTPPSG